MLASPPCTLMGFLFIGFYCMWPSPSLPPYAKGLQESGVSQLANCFVGRARLHALTLSSKFAKKQQLAVQPQQALLSPILHTCMPKAQTILPISLFFLLTFCPMLSFFWFVYCYIHHTAAALIHAEIHAQKTDMAAVVGHSSLICIYRPVHIYNLAGAGG